MIPYHDENETVRPAVVTIGLIAICALMWLFRQGGGSEYLLAESVCNLGLIPGELTQTLRAGLAFPLGEGLSCVIDPGPQYLNVLTSMFLHGGWMHLIGNMWFLWLFGNNIEDSMTRPRFIAFYLLCGLGAAFAQVMADPQSVHPDGRRLGRNQRSDGRLSRALPAGAGVYAAPTGVFHHHCGITGVGDVALLDGASGVRWARANRR